MTRVLVFGGRFYRDQGRLWRVLDRFYSARGISLIIHGDYPKGRGGADRLAKRWAISLGIEHKPFEPDWTAFGRAAGPMRNQCMLDEGKPDYAIGFPGGDGTADMLRRVKDAKLDHTMFDR